MEHLVGKIGVLPPVSLPLGVNPYFAVYHPWRFDSSLPGKSMIQAIRFAFIIKI